MPTSLRSSPSIASAFAAEAIDPGETLLLMATMDILPLRARAGDRIWVTPSTGRVRVTRDVAIDLGAVEGLVRAGVLEGSREVDQRVVATMLAPAEPVRSGRASGRVAGRIRRSRPR